MEKERTFYVDIQRSRQPLTAIEKIKFKDLGDCLKLDELTKESSIIFVPANDIIVNVHNEKAEDKDYKNYIIIDAEGNKYLTGSNSFWNAYSDIMDELTDADVDPVAEGIHIKVYRLPSKNYKGKEFITCSLN